MTYIEAKLFVSQKRITLSKHALKLLDLIGKKGFVLIPQSGRRKEDTAAVQDLHALGIVERVQGEYFETVKLR